MHHLKNTEHEKAAEKLTTGGRKQHNTFIKDKIEKKIQGEFRPVIPNDLGS